MHKRILAVGTALVMILLTVNSLGWAAPQLQARSVITYPPNSATLSGVVEVMGIATHPNMNFYQLRYAAGPEPTGGSQWVDFAFVEGTVENDVLGAWDTTAVPDGQYTLALAVWGVDDPSNPYVFFVTGLTVNNAQPVATPTTEPPTPEPLPTAMVGPTPTPVAIVQPATSTPRPSPTPPGEVAEGIAAPPTEGEEGRFSVPLDVPELRTAFCTGGLITVMLLLLWGFYLFIKAVVRWFLRQQRTDQFPR